MRSPTLDEIAVGQLTAPPGLADPREWAKGAKRRRGALMVRDLLLALLITVVAVVLGITVHPLLFLIIVFAVLLLFMRRSAW